MEGRRVLLVATLGKQLLAFHMPYVRFLQDWGFEVHVACDPGGKEDRLAAAGIKVFPIPVKRSPWRLENVIALVALMRLMRREGYRLLHTHTPVASFVARLAAHLAGAGPVVYTAHGFHFHRGAPLQNWILYYPLEWLAARWTDALVAINAEDYSRATRLPVRGQVYLVPGVGVPLPEEARPPEGMTVLTAGDLSANKNVGEVLRAWRLVLRALPNAQLLIAGEGPQAVRLRRLAARLGVGDRIRFLGFREDLPEFLARARVVVSASRREGLPRVILEAMAAARPVVVTDVRGHRDLVNDGQTGFLVPRDDPEAMAAAVIRLLTDHDLFATMGARARECVAEYAVNRVVQAVGAIYAEWIGERYPAQ